MNRIDYNGVATAGTMWSADWPFRLPATADRSRALNGFVRCAVAVPEGRIWAQRRFTLLTFDTTRCFLLSTWRSHRAIATRPDFLVGFNPRD